MRKNVLVIEPISSHEMIIHTPFSLTETHDMHPVRVDQGGTVDPRSAQITDAELTRFTRPSLMSMLFVYHGLLDMELTRPIGEYSLQVVIPRTARPDRALQWVLSVIVTEMKLGGLDELRIQYSDGVTREFDQLIGSALKKLARVEWDDDRGRAVYGSKSGHKQLEAEVASMMKRLYEINDEIKAIDARHDAQVREESLALRSYQRAQRGPFKPELLLKTGTRWSVAQAKVKADPEHMVQLVDQRTDLARAAAAKMRLRDLAEREIDELKARKCPKFYAKTVTKAGTVAMRIAS